MSLPWFKLFLEDFDSVEADALADALGDVDAWRFIVRLTAWAVEQAQKPGGDVVDAGRVGHLGPVALSKAAGFRGDTAVFFAAVRSAGVVLPNGVIVGWGRQAPTIVKAARDAGRKATARAAARAVDDAPGEASPTSPPVENRAARAPARAEHETARAAARATHLSVSSGSSSVSEKTIAEEREERLAPRRAPEPDPFDVGGEDDAPPPRALVPASVQPGPIARRPLQPLRRMSRGLLGDDEREHEPKTVPELLARAKTYPHHPAVAEADSLGAFWRAEFPAFDGNGGRPTLERAIEIGPWAHWQSADARETHARWIWPLNAAGKFEEWLRKAYPEAMRSLTSQKGAEARGIDPTKGLEKPDPVRDELRAAYRRLRDAGRDLPPAATWIDDMIATGRILDVRAELRTIAAARAEGERVAEIEASPTPRALPAPKHHPADDPDAARIAAEALARFKVAGK